MDEWLMVMRHGMQAALRGQHQQLEAMDLALQTLQTYAKNVETEAMPHEEAVVGDTGVRSLAQRINASARWEGKMQASATTLRGSISQGLGEVIPRVAVPPLAALDRPTPKRSRSAGPAGGDLGAEVRQAVAANCTHARVKAFSPKAVVIEMPDAFDIVLGVARSGADGGLAVHDVSVCRCRENSDPSLVASPWRRPGSNVFRHLTRVCLAAALHFAEASPPGIDAFSRFLVWLDGYHGVFSQPCALCNRLLAQDALGLLPPTLRPYDCSGLPYHAVCYELARD